MKRLTVVAAAVAALAGFIGVPAAASAAQSAGAPPATNQVHDVLITVADQAVVVGGVTVIKDAKVAAGSPLKIRNVPKDAQLFLQYGADFSKTLPLTPSAQQSRTWLYNSLPPASRFWVRVLAPDGTKSLVRFSTGPAQNTFGGQIHPVADSSRCKHSVCKYGVGIPIRIEFDIPIADKYKAGIESALRVDSAKPLGKASWAWLNDTTIGFRPRQYWPANDKINVVANLASVEGAHQVWGTNFSMKFETGPKVVLRSSIDKYRMTFWKDDVKVKTFDVSYGRDGNDTSSGIKVISEEYGYQKKVLWNPDPKNGWKIRVNYAIRITWDGEFIHSAPWNYSLGQANLSHGCTNMSNEDSKWVYDNVRIGDVVESSGSPVKVTQDAVYGYWNYSWSQWRAMSALPTAISS